MNPPYSVMSSLLAVMIGTLLMLSILSMMMIGVCIVHCLHCVGCALCIVHIVWGVHCARRNRPESGVGWSGGFSWRLVTPSQAGGPPPISIHAS